MCRRFSVRMMLGGASTRVDEMRQALHLHDVHAPRRGLKPDAAQPLGLYAPRVRHRLHRDADLSKTVGRRRARARTRACDATRHPTRRGRAARRTSSRFRRGTCRPTARAGPTTTARTGAAPSAASARCSRACRCRGFAVDRSSRCSAARASSRCGAARAPWPSATARGARGPSACSASCASRITPFGFAGACSRWATTASSTRARCRRRSASTSAGIRWGP